MSNVEQQSVVRVSYVNHTFFLSRAVGTLPWHEQIKSSPRGTVAPDY